MERKRKEEAERQARVAAERARAARAAAKPPRVSTDDVRRIRVRAGRERGGLFPELRVGISSRRRCRDASHVRGHARRRALDACTEAARAAISASARSDQRAKRMMGDASPIGVESGGWDDVEFDHWMRVAQARLDAELRQLVSRAAAGLELTRVSRGEPGRRYRNRARRSCGWNARRCRRRITITCRIDSSRRRPRRRTRRSGRRRRIWTG